jgi:hypothetical protein
MDGETLFAGSSKPSAPVSPNDPDERGGQVVCIQNIGQAERRKRLTFGLFMLVAGLAIGTLLIAARAGALWRLILFLPFAGGAIGFFQAREKT